MKKRIAAVLISSIMLFALAGSAAAQSPTAVIRVWSGSGLPGATSITVPVTLQSQNGAQVSGLNFDLIFDGSQLQVSNVTKGNALPAGKILYWSPQPCTASCQVIIFGIDQDVIPDGTVANIVFDVLPLATPGNDVTLDLDNAAAAHPTDSDPDANLESMIDGSFTILSPPTNTPVPSETPTPSNTPIPPTATSSATSGPSPTPSLTLTPSLTPTPSNTSPPTATHTPGPSPTASSTPSGTLTASPTATVTPTRLATTTRTLNVKGAGEGLELEGAAAATGTALAKFEGAISATSTALAEEAAARPTDEIISTGPTFGTPIRPEIIVVVGLLLVAITLGGGAAYLIWRRGRAKA